MTHSMSPEQPIDDQAGSLQRLWTPWRMRYVGGGRTEPGCIFCNRLAAEDDRVSLILHRGGDAFVIMNLFPYNTGHVMLVPNQHTASPEDASHAATVGVARLRRPVLRSLRRALSCDGFNLGLNVGAVAGAGVADHMHEHVVPRWTGDANFMPILAETLVLPELIPVTYAKVRAELVREVHGAMEVTGVLVSTDRRTVLVDQEGRLPRLSLVPGQPVWRGALEAARALVGSDIELRGWAGSGRATATDVSLLFAVAPAAHSRTSDGSAWSWAPVQEATAVPADSVAAAVEQSTDTTPEEPERQVC